MFNKIIYKSYALNYDNSFPQKKTKIKMIKICMLIYSIQTNACTTLA